MTLKTMENLVYEQLKDHPNVKNSVKFGIQAIGSAFGRHKQHRPSNLVIRENAFFGFHDKDPWSCDNSMLAAHRYIGKGNETNGGAVPVEIIVYKGDDWTKPEPITETYAWNWQQGSQLQWIRNRDSLIFNQLHETFCSASVYDFKTQRTKNLDLPIAATAPSGDLFASICFKTFGASMPGYGYETRSGSIRNEIGPDTLVIWSCHTPSLNAYSTKELDRATSNSFNSNTVSPFVSHPQFSPDSSRVAFLRRKAKHNRRIESELLIGTSRSESLLNSPFRGMVSHFTWLGNHHIFAFANHLGKDGYYLWEIDSQKVEDHSYVLGRRDGHMHSTPNGSRTVIDGYPDSLRLQPLYEYDPWQRNKVEIARLHSPIAFFEKTRVDLHPRLRKDGKYISLDCSLSGRRSLATLYLDTV